MHSRTKYGEEILKEISILPEHLQQKMSKIVLFLKKEMVENRLDEQKATDDFISVCGKWKDYRQVEDQISDIIAYRKSTDRTKNIF